VDDAVSGPVEKQTEVRAIDELNRRLDALHAAMSRMEFDRMEYHFDRVRKAVQKLERAQMGQEPADEPFGFYQYLHDKARGRYSR
jgi:CCR4-NOT transcriptional regulation complex NOT5 subunit